MALAAGACSTSTTAMLVLEEVARLRPGERVLMHAAAGGIGSQLGQAARLGGAGRVVGASAPRPAEAALAFGYDQVVVRDELDGDAGFDVVVDPVGGPARWASLDALALGGRLVVMGTASGAPDVAFGANELWLASKGVLGFNLAAFSATHPDRAGQALRGAVDAVLAGQLHVELRDRLPSPRSPTRPPDRVRPQHRQARTRSQP
jgi:NADPH:quinone reductase